MEERIKRYAQASIAIKQHFFQHHASAIAQAVNVLVAAIQAGGKVLLFGNGGSAADAQHIAAELVNRLTYDRPPIAAIALTTDTSILTSIGNDSSFEEVFERQLCALGRAGDVAIAISTSGNSPNVIRAVEAARRLNMKVVGLSGRDGGKLAALCDVALIVEAHNTQHIQETHITLAHLLCELIQEAVFPQER
ncbi:MAG: D-sedoheptulose 7-phosphate isomerase [Acidobacteria bacterium]|nr:D-sedoheptulose 7-phosphate isomerase [Acidobacteriota bacterium]